MEDKAGLGVYLLVSGLIHHHLSVMRLSAEGVERYLWLCLHDGLCYELTSRLFV